MVIEGKVPENIKKLKAEKDLVEEAVEGLKKDPLVYPEIQRLGLSVKKVRCSLSLLLDYQVDRNICAKCKGLSACPKEDGTYEMGLLYEGGVLSGTFSLCHKKMDDLEMRSRFALRDFPDEWLEADLLSVDRTQNRTAALVAMRDIIKGNSSKWCYIQSNSSSGKSYAAAAFASSFSKRNKVQVAFCDTASLIEDLKDKAYAKEKKPFESKMGLLESIPLLVLDDFGNEFKSEYSFATFLFPILKERSSRGLLTAFTSEFSIDEIREMYEPKIGSVRAKQLSRLLTERCEKELSYQGVPGLY